VWAFLFVLLSLPLLLLLVESVAEQVDRRRYPAPGSYLAAGARKLHFCEQGTGPTVILESGIVASSLSWVLTQPPISEFARVIAYDRAGLGWSSTSTFPVTLEEVLSDLKLLIESVEGGSRVILVGHSFGGLIVRAFASLHPDRVAGLVLVDPVSLDTYSGATPAESSRLRMGVRLSRRGALLARFAIVRIALALVARGKRKLPSLIGRVSAGRGSSVMNRLAGEIAKLPPHTHAAIRSHWSRPASFQRMAGYLALLPEAAGKAKGMSLPSELPVIILSAGTATAAELGERDGWLGNHPVSRHTQIPDTTHWIQLDRPEAVADAVRELARARPYCY
jgi:pimeloyl-ACP methyl ester carboxylesterase